ncbi:MAG: TIGR04255 family protein [Xanthobacteraceae bacterium]|nr:TIGR04255 family protein [Xanthobacteraceae bacterium]
MNWEPVHSDHSIDNVSAIFVFQANLSDMFDDLAVAAKKASARFELTHRAEFIEPIELPAGSGVANFEIDGRNVPRRVAYQRLDDQRRVIDELSISATKLTLTTARYRRWADFYERLVGIYRDMQIYSAVNFSIKSVQLQYLDRFLSLTDEASHFQVLDTSSRYLVPAVSNIQNALHVHSGWFEFNSNEVRQLTNVNIDVGQAHHIVSGDLRKSVSILTMRKLEALSGDLEDALGCANDLHNGLKDLFRSVVTTAAASRVGLA